MHASASPPSADHRGVRVQASFGGERGRRASQVTRGGASSEASLLQVALADVGRGVHTRALPRPSRLTAEVIRASRHILLRRGEAEAPGGTRAPGCYRTALLVARRQTPDLGDDAGGEEVTGSRAEEGWTWTWSGTRDRRRTGRGPHGREASVGRSVRIGRSVRVQPHTPSFLSPFFARPQKDTLAWSGHVGHLETWRIRPVHLRVGGGGPETALPSRLGVGRFSTREQPRRHGVSSPAGAEKYRLRRDRLRFSAFHAGPEVTGSAARRTCPPRHAARRPQRPQPRDS